MTIIKNRDADPENGDRGSNTPLTSSSLSLGLADPIDNFSEEAKYLPRAEIISQTPLYSIRTPPSSLLDLFIPRRLYNLQQRKPLLLQSHALLGRPPPNSIVNTMNPTDIPKYNM